MLKIPKLLFGPSSIPYSSPKQETCEGIKQVKRLGLGNMELGWVQGVKLSEEKASIMLVSVTSMPEIKCNNDDCLDTAKLLVFGNSMRDNFEHYKINFGEKRIFVEQIYPENNGSNVCDFRSYNNADYPRNCKKWILYDNARGKGFLVSTPVLLYYPETDKYGIGKLVVEAEK